MIARSRKVRVGVNLLWLVPGVVGGSEEYTTRLLLGVAERAPEDIEIVLFVSRSFRGAYPELVRRFETHTAPIDGTSKLVRVLAEATWLAAAGRRAKLDVLHHAGGTIPPVRSTPAIVTIHDLQPLLLPANFNFVKQAYLRWRLPPSVKRSHLVITLTEHARRSVIERLGADPEQVVKVPPGFTLALNQEPPHHDPAATYRIDGPFFLYPAITYPHKNHLVLVHAMAKVVAERPDALLVLTSSAAQMEAQIESEAERLGIAGNIRRLGRIPRGDLDWLVRHACGLTFPSRFEGFGLPVLEAMGNGCPVIAADSTALPEVVGNAGLLLDPDDVEAWADAMIVLLDEPLRREWLIEAGLGRTTAYRWSASTDAMLDAYRRAVDRLGSRAR